MIVDDIIDSGETQEALIRIAQKAKAEVTGIYALFSISNEWKARIGSAMNNCTVEIALELPQKQKKSEVVA